MNRLRRSFAALCLLTSTAMVTVEAQTDLQSREDPPVDGDVTLDEAVVAALRSNPALRADSYRVAKRRAEIEEARQIPNPDLRLELADFAGRGERRGFESSESTLLLAQVIETGGKRGLRVARAASAGDAESFRYQSEHRATVAKVTKAFFAALIAQDRVALEDEEADTVAATVKTLERQLEAGAVGPFDVAGARLLARRVELAQISSRQTLDLARAELARSWGGAAAGFGRLVGASTPLPPMPSRSAAVGHYEDHPRLLRRRSEVETQTHALALARAERFPDITVAAGPRYYGDDDTAAAVVQASMPLPIFSAGGAAVETAQQRLALAHATEELTRSTLGRSVEKAYNEMSAAHDRYRLLTETVAPAAKAAQDAVISAQRYGAARYTDVLEAHREVFDLRRQRLDAVADFHAAAADLEELSDVAIHQLTATIAGMR